MFNTTIRKAPPKRQSVVKSENDSDLLEAATLSANFVTVKAQQRIKHSTQIMESKQAAADQWNRDAISEYIVQTEHTKKCIDLSVQHGNLHQMLNDLSSFSSDANQFSGRYDRNKDVFNGIPSFEPNFDTVSVEQVLQSERHVADQIRLARMNESSAESVLTNSTELSHILTGEQQKVPIIKKNLEKAIHSLTDLTVASLSGLTEIITAKVRRHAAEKKQENCGSSSSDDEENSPPYT